jgi:putative endonuclease
MAGRSSVEMFYAYVLRSQKDNKLYIGFCSDLKKRFLEHSNGKVDSTRPRRPLTLVNYEACLGEKKAIKREKYFKKWIWKKIFKRKNLITLLL